MSTIAKSQVIASPKRFEVRGLFGQYNHCIDLPQECSFRIIHGPNGVGKTKTLRLLEAVAKVNFFGLRETPYSEAILTLDDGRRIEVERSAESLEEEIPEIRLYSTGGDLCYKYGPAIASNQRFQAGGTEWIEVAADVWMDVEDGERVSTEDLKRRFGEDPNDSVDEEIRVFRDSFVVSLIETDRLVRTPANLRRKVRHPYSRIYPRDSPEVLPSAVSRYTEDMRANLNVALANNSRVSAAKDRTFPRRILEESWKVADHAETEIRERYSTQSEKRQQLAALSLVSEGHDLPLPARDLLDWERRVLWIYLDDTEEKLETFDEVLRKTQLLLEIINERFVNKSINVSAEKGLQIVTATGESIPPGALSSGEQHELIMFYDLLFRARPGSLVMIDEPELSLHVAWQRRFLTDIERVSALSKVRVLIATHSPLIIGEHLDEVIELRLQDGERPTGSVD